MRRESLAVSFQTLASIEAPAPENASDKSRLRQIKQLIPRSCALRTIFYKSIGEKSQTGPFLSSFIVIQMHRQTGRLIKMNAGQIPGAQFRRY